MAEVTFIDDGSNRQFVIGEKSPPGKPKNYEDVIVAMGRPGIYQISQLFIMFLCVLPLASITMKYVFISKQPSFTCSSVNESMLLQDQSYVSNTTVSYHISYAQACELEILSNTSGLLKTVDQVKCIDGYDFTGGKDVSIITEWGLVCDQTGIAELSQTVISIGGFIGAIIADILADKYGRKIVIIVSLLLTCVTDISTSFSPNIYVLIILRFFTGLVSGGTLICVYVLNIEMFVSKYREMFAMFSGTVWAIHVMLMCGIAYALRDAGWREYQLYTSLVGMAPLLILWFMDESPTWLHTMGNYKHAKKIVNKACRMNGRDFNTVKVTLDECFQDIKSQDNTQSNTVPLNVFDLFINKKLLLITSVTLLASFTNEVTFAGLYFTASTLVGDHYLNMFFLALLSIPGCIINWILLKYKGRKFVIILFMFMTAICLLISTCLANFGHDTTHVTNISTAFFLLGKFSVSACYNTLYMYIPEAYPTSIRSTGTGIASTAAYIGGAVAPYLLPLHAAASWAPGTFLAAFCFITGFLFTRLPETKGKQLKVQIYE